jgi:hypothetical protein
MMRRWRKKMLGLEPVSLAVELGGKEVEELTTALSGSW